MCETRNEGCQAKWQGRFGSNPDIHVPFNSSSLDFIAVMISDEKYEHEFLPV